MTTPSLAADRSKAERALREAIAAEDASGVEKACDDLIECGGKEALNAILGPLGKGIEGGIYWQLVGGASGFKDKAALDELGRYVVGHQADGRASLARDLLFGLQNNRSTLAAVPLDLVLKSGKYDLQLMAVDQLAVLRCVESIDALIAGLKREWKKDAELKARIEGALETLTGERFGDPATWEIWWKTQRPQGVPAPKKEEKAKADGPRTGERPRDKEFSKTVERGKPEQIVVLTSQGDFDHMQEIVEKHKIPHVVVTRPDFEADPDKHLKGCYALLVNCSGDKLGKPALDKIKAWTEAGGFLYTEDWSFDVTTACWPEMVTEPGKLPEMTVKLSPGKGQTSHPLMRGVWQKPAPAAKDDEGGGTMEKVESPAKKIEHQWKVDGASSAIKVNDATNVIVLLEAEELSKQPGGNTAVAITFRVGRGGPEPKKQATGAAPSKGTGEWSLTSRGGRVLHTLSHWGHQPGTEDGAALHNMLINFLLEAAKRNELGK